MADLDRLARAIARIRAAMAAVDVEVSELEAALRPGKRPRPQPTKDDRERAAQSLRRLGLEPPEKSKT